MRKIIFFFLAILIITTLACSNNINKIPRYQCQDFENWARPECNPPLCITTRMCTVDLYPPEYWRRINLQIFPIVYDRLYAQNWIEQGNVHGLTLEQYIVAQNLRYVKALQEQDKKTIDELSADADRVGYYLIPSKYLRRDKSAE